MSILIRVIDYETTGFPPEAGIMEIGWTDVHYTDKDSIAISLPQSRFCDPNRKCEHAARAVHHIKDSDIAGQPSPEVILASLSEGVNIFCAHNSKFEKQFWTPTDPEGVPLPWICTFKAALRLCPSAPNHQNQTIRYFLNHDFGENESFTLPPHRAGPDTFVTAHTLAKFLKAVPPETLVDWELEPPHFPYCPIGAKERGKPWADVEQSFLMWIIRTPTMEADIKFNARKELDRRAGR